MSVDHEDLTGRLTFLASEGLEVDLELVRTPSVAIEIRCGAELLPFPESFAYEVTPVQGNGYESSAGSSENGIWFGVSEPGQYEVTLTDLDGCVLPNSVRIDLPPGPRQTVVISAHRK